MEIPRGYQPDKDGSILCAKAVLSKWHTSRKIEPCAIAGGSGPGNRSEPTFFKKFNNQ